MKLLSVNNVSKKFSVNLHQSMLNAWGELALSLAGLSAEKKLKQDEFQAVHNISLDLNKGQILCILGNNGSGKTTLMRMIYGIYSCDEGSIRAYGNIAAMFALRTGMQPYFTGRENIRLKGSILGFSEQELAEKTESIIEFSELGTAIDKPFGSYSSGMMSRLAYSLAIAMQPDIFIIDEGLAVGDMAFKNKCLDDLKKKREERGVIFITHNFERIKDIATDIIIMDKGCKIMETSNVHEGLDYYLSNYSKTSVNI